MACIAWLSGQKDGEFEVKSYKPKRSLSANNYYWELVEQISQAMHLSKDEVHRSLLNDYGTWERNSDGSPKWVILPDNEPLPKDGYFYDTKANVTVTGTREGVKSGHAYIVIKGSHQYDSKEMSVLIDGAVQEAMNLGIDTRTPEEISLMIQQMERKE